MSESHRGVPVELHRYSIGVRVLVRTHNLVSCNSAVRTATIRSSELLGGLSHRFVHDGQHLDTPYHAHTLMQPLRSIGTHKKHPNTSKCSPKRNCPPNQPILSSKQNAEQKQSCNWQSGEEKKKRQFAREGDGEGRLWRGRWRLFVGRRVTGDDGLRRGTSG